MSQSCVTCSHVIVNRDCVFVFVFVCALLYLVYYECTSGRGRANKFSADPERQPLSPSWRKENRDSDGDIVV